MNTNQVHNKLPLRYYHNADVVFLAKDLLGKQICTNFNNKLTSGIIVETEAYRSIDDKASHAYLQRRTKKNQAMYLDGGVAYVYLCYGIHALFNIVTNREDVADAILVRAIEPIDGVNIMKQRSSKDNILQLASGPGKLSVSLGINISSNKEQLTADTIWIQNNQHIKDYQIVAKKRVGIHYAEEDANFLWRFYIKGNKYISKK